MNNIKKALFETEAFKIAEADNPFWYTSGMIGPFFVNTHYLYGGEKEAKDLLDFIDKKSYDRLVFCNELHDRIINFYKHNKLFNSVINDFYAEIKDEPLFQESTYISGGERRDWFFSIPIAYLSDKKPLFIFKDLSIYSLVRQEKQLNGQTVTHIADLITVASSYERAWIPALDNVNGKLKFTASIVDRIQGGKEILQNHGIKSYSSINIDQEFFESAKDAGIINEDQLKSVLDFTSNSLEYGKNFLTTHKDFLKNAINSENKSTADKANRCVTENPYNMDM